MDNDPRFDPPIIIGPTKISGAVFAIESLPGGGARTIRFDGGVWRPSVAADVAEIITGVPYALTNQDRSQTILVAAMGLLNLSEQKLLLVQLRLEAKTAAEAEAKNRH